MNHLEILSESFHGYFGVGELETSQEWIINSYFFNLDYILDDELLEDKLIELCTNRFLKMQFFQCKTLEQYWCCALFQKLYEKLLSMLIPLATTYLCKSGSSTLFSIKTKSRNHLNAQADMRIAISNKVPRLRNSCAINRNKRVIRYKVDLKLIFNLFKILLHK